MKTKQYRNVSVPLAKLSTALLLQAATCTTSVGQNTEPAQKNNQEHPAVPAVSGSTPIATTAIKPAAAASTETATAVTATETETSEATENDGGGSVSSKSAGLDVSGYKFNTAGMLVDNDKPYVYNTSNYNAIVGHAKTLMLKALKAKGMVEYSQYYATEGALASNAKVMVLVHGFNNSAPGVWSGALLVGKGTTIGSMLPFIEKARSAGYEVVIPNSKVDGDIGAALNAVKQASHIAIVANSAGVQGCISTINSWTEAETNKISIAYVDGGENDSYQLQAAAITGNSIQVFQNRGMILSTFKRKLEAVSGLFNSRNHELEPRSEPYNYSVPADGMDGIFSFLG